jgi:acetyltransferase-like isoleucine patch superfamily enzyme
MKGEIKLISKAHTGMVRLGIDGNALFAQIPRKFAWSNYGGTVEFGDGIIFNQGCALEIGQNATLSLHDNLYFGPLTRIACFDHITVGENSRFAWEIILMDTDFHSTINVNTGERSAITKPVIIGKNNWIGTRSFIMKGTHTPDFCIASGMSLLNKKYDIPNYSLIGGIPAKFLKEGLYRDLESHVNPDMK